MVFSEGLYAIFSGTGIAAMVIAEIKQSAPIVRLTVLFNLLFCFLLAFLMDFSLSQKTQYLITYIGNEHILI